MITSRISSLHGHLILRRIGNRRNERYDQTSITGEHRTIERVDDKQQGLDIDGIVVTDLCYCKNMRLMKMIKWAIWGCNGIERERNTIHNMWNAKYQDHDPSRLKRAVAWANPASQNFACFQSYVSVTLVSGVKQVSYYIVEKTRQNSMAQCVRDKSTLTTDACVRNSYSSTMKCSTPWKLHWNRAICFEATAFDSSDPASILANRVLMKFKILLDRTLSESRTNERTNGLYYKGTEYGKEGNHKHQEDLERRWKTGGSVQPLTRKKLVSSDCKICNHPLFILSTKRCLG